MTVSKSSFSLHELDDHHRALLLDARRPAGTYIRKLGGFCGTIYLFHSGGASAPLTCAKVPRISATVDAREASRRFLREIKIQREMYYSFFVLWPFDFDFVFDTPVAWFRFWGTDLSQLLDDQTFSFIGRLSVLAYVTSGMMHCHRMGLVAHQDLKPENIFVSDLRSSFRGLPEEDVFRVPKIGDFGSANLASEVREFRGTRPYMAPEQWEERPLGQHTTAWSLGILSHELLSYGYHPIGEATMPWRRYPERHRKWQKDRMWKRWIGSSAPIIRGVQDPQMDHLISACLSIEPERRPTLPTILESILERIGAISSDARIQTEFRIRHAQEESAGEHDWPYLDKRYDEIMREADRRFA